MPCYGREILEEVSKRYGVSVERLERYEESTTGSFLYSIMAMAKAQIGDAEMLGAEGQMVRNIVLFGVLIYELVGPTLTRIALTKSGDITPRVEPVASADD